MFSHRRSRPTTNDRLNSVLENAVRERFEAIEGEKHSKYGGGSNESYTSKGAFFIAFLIFHF